MFEDDSTRNITRRRLLALFAGAVASGFLPRLGFAENAARPLRVAVSMETLAGANVNDARAAYRVWSQEVTKNLGYSGAELVPDIFVPSEQIVRMIKQGSIDMFGITAWEILKVIDMLDSTLLIEDYLAKSGGMEYVLLVHNASSFKQIGDLRGRHLAIHHHRDMNLVPAWIGNLLAADKLPRMDLFFGEQTLRDSVTQVVLPVFFRRIDAACLGRKAFETAVELNPQLGRDIRVLAISPRVIPIALCFQKNCSREAKRQLIEVITRAESMPAGRQIVALYQSQVLVPQPTSCMNVTLEMLHRYANVVAHTPLQQMQLKGPAALPAELKE
jgi:phosphonate transport system substrate-binding protein